MALFANQVFVGHSTSEECKFSMLSFGETASNGSIELVVKVAIPTIIAIEMAKIILNEAGIEIKEMIRQ